MNQNGKPDRSRVRSALRALELLECFTPARPQISLSELAREAGLPVSTAARLLSTLSSTGFLKKDKNGLYSCGIRLLPIALATLQGQSIYTIAKPHLEALRDATGETANLAVPGPDGRPIYTRHAESRQAIHHKVWLGETLPLEGTAMGEALSGKVGDDGCARRIGSIEPDVAAIAAPVRNSENELVGGISLTLPIYRITDDKLERFAALVAKHAAAMSGELGWQAT